MTDNNAIKSKRIYWASGIVSICGIIFEVLFGALGSYILGDGVKQYTLTISLFLTGMGIGSFLSERVMKKLIQAFIIIEFAVAFIGGFSAFLLFGVTAYLGSGSDAIFLYATILVIGTLTGLELPILIRKANEIGVQINKSTARVLFSDYAGGLIGGLLFLFLFRPQFGLVKTAFLVAIINIIVALWVLYTFRKEIAHLKAYSVMGGFILFLLIGGVMFGEEMAFSFEQKIYNDPIIYVEDTKYQHIILTKEQGDLRLYLNGQLQFSSSDEYRYHETLVHIPMSLAEPREDILVLGGGDGLALRELEKYQDTKEVTLVDLDPRMVKLAKNNPQLAQLNENSFENEKVHVVHEDAFDYMESAKGFYDVILVDLPDPNNESLNKLYTLEFYSLLRNHLAPGGMIMVQATSPVFARKVYWTIDETISGTGMYTENFHLDIPSFGNWGFVLAARKPIDISDIDINVDTKYLSTDLIPSLTKFGKDEDGTIANEDGEQVELKPNTLIRPNLIEKYERAWRNY
ncbi:polyamine aminopropyltransferase [Alkalihalobacillus sp. AL-G]|uniref:polyamine aminopropyltransferase n=1 Tax=Alkalihalobacillus sp. AL-G TaxID=2926399 RepID=UPI00272D9495|nr:polyamine aminopropyltransferase [Alkalihalobacillus sp. AL-G]WLD94769.1 polyamine aminopropyltransferase [Alkalihalobacillus sp. AL-G]